jgi:hypothetical protein
MNAYHKIFFILIICAVGLIGHPYAAEITRPQLSADVPLAYYIDARLDTSADILSGTETIFFKNPTQKPIDRYAVHLYPNAFADTLTLLAKNSPLLREAIAANPGYLTCDSIQVDGAVPDSVILDETLLYIYPKYPLKPGRTARINLQFDLKVSGAIERMGKNDKGNYLFAHWYPILAGYQKGNPIIYQYGSDGEFFSNFADYEIKLQIPSGFTLGSTANINQPDSTHEGFDYYTLEARRVIDFAIACGPAWESETFYFQNIAINILYNKKNEDKLEDIKHAINESIGYFNKLLFVYPYANIGYIDFNPGAGGMELPRIAVFSFAQSEWRNKHALADVLIHETAHQWFYAIVASNEFDDPWLDEGLVTYLTERAMKHIYGDVSMVDFYGLSAGYIELYQFINRFFPSADPLATVSDKFYKDSYFNNVYGKGAAVFLALQGVLGDKEFDKALKEYATRYEYGHPDISDLEHSFETSTGIDLGRFFSDYVYGTARVDYEVASINIEPRDSLFVSTVELRRNYDGVLPQDVVIGFKDGNVESRHWDGIAKYESYKFESKYPATWAAIDTAGYYLLDENYANNSFKFAPETGYSVALTEIGAFVLQIIMIIGGML